MDWIAAGIVFVCLVALAVDFGGRWGRPRLYLDFRNPLTYGVLGIIGAALALSLLTGQIVDVAIGVLRYLVVFVGIAFIVGIVALLVWGLTE